MDDYVKRFTLILVIVGMMIASGFTAAREPIVFVDYLWESARVHNRIAGFIAEHGYGYDVEYMIADGIVAIQGMHRGELDVSMESWYDNTPAAWDEPLEAGTIIDLGHNFSNAPQGWYVPTYVIEGDSERGIEPMAPDLRSVFDLPRYKDLFQDPEVPDKGRFYNGITGWITSEQNTMKLTAYGLDDTYENFYPGSQAAVDASIARAFERGEPWFGYYWEPTWVMGKYDMTLLEEPEYDDACWTEEAGFGCAFPFGHGEIFVNAQLIDKAPDFVEFLKNYETELDHSNDMLAYMQTENVGADETALWFLHHYEDLWSAWLDDDIRSKVKSALKSH